MSGTRLRAAILLVGLSVAAACAQQPKLSNLQPAMPTDASPLQLSHRLLNAGRFRDAEGALRAYLAQNDLSEEAHEMLAYALLREDKPRESLAEYTRAASLHRPSAGMLERVGQDYVLLNDYSDADKWTLQAVEMDPSDADAWYGLGRIRFTEQRFDDALSCFQRVLVLSPKNVKAENNLGLTYDALNRTDAAVTAYRQAIAWQDAGAPSERSEQPLINLATVLIQRGNLTEAQPLLTQAAGIAPNNARIHEQLGHLYLQQSNFARAQKEFERACRLEPGKSSLHFLLGQAYKHLGRRQQAEAQFKIASKLALEAATPKAR